MLGMRILRTAKGSFRFASAKCRNVFQMFKNFVRMKKASLTSEKKFAN